MKKNGLFFAMLGKGMVIAMLALGLVFVGCDSDDGGSGGGIGRIPAELVGSWTFEFNPDDPGLVLLLINANGSGKFESETVTWKVSGSTITYTWKPSSQPGTSISESATWRISSDLLYISNASGLTITTGGTTTQTGGGWFWAMTQPILMYPNGPPLRKMNIGG